MLLDNDSVRLRHIVQACEEIFEFVEDRDVEFLLHDLLLQKLLIHNLQIIGEASARLTAELKQAHSDVPWQNIIGMRHRIVHDYFNVDLEIVYRTVRDFLPGLHAKAMLLLDEGRGDD